MTTWVSIFIISSTVGQLNLQTKQTFSCQHHICPRRARSFWPLGPELTWPRASNLCSHTAASASASQSCLERPGNTRPWGSTCTALALGMNRVGAQICGGARGGPSSAWAKAICNDSAIPKQSRTCLQEFWRYSMQNDLSNYMMTFEFVVVQSLSHVWLFSTPWTVARQASLCFTISLSLLKLMSIESVMPSNQLILHRPLVLLPWIFPSIRVIYVLSFLTASDRITRGKSHKGKVIWVTSWSLFVSTFLWRFSTSRPPRPREMSLHLLSSCISFDSEASRWHLRPKTLFPKKIMFMGSKTRIRTRI